MKRILALALAFVLVLGYIPVGVSAADGDYTVAGTFNGWSTTATPMTDNRNGTHTVTLPLAAGYYEFKVTDGTWNNNWGGTGPDGNYPLTVVRDCDVTFKFLLSGEKASVLVDDKVTVYFVNSENWTNVYAYTWSDSQLHMGAWGGTMMANVADNIWSVKIPAADASNIIFHNGSGTQTGNLSVPYDGRLVYTYNSGWTTCASSHLMSNGTCQICGASCSHSSHGTDGNCSSCGLNVGHSYPSTGLCACGLQAEALVDDIHFASFDSAINVVSPGGTIKLLTDVTAGTVNGNNGHNLDLNGKTLTVSELWAPSTSFLRIQDNTTAQEGKIVGDVYTSQYLYLEGGTIEGTVWLTSYSQLKGSFTMTGGAIKADTDLYINTDGAAVELQGGEFIDGLKLVNRNTVSIPMTLADTISSGYGFYQNGSVVDMTGVTDTISGSTVKVQNHTHAYSSTTGFCPCGDECAHSSKTNGVCDTCGMADAHTHEYVDGACSCGQTAQVLVTYSDSTTKYFDTLQAALDTFSKNNSFAYVKLLTNIAVGDNISADTYTHYTLDLNGYSLTAERLIVPASGGMEIMDTSAGQTGQINAIVHAQGPLTIWSGTFNDTVLVTTMSNVKGSVTVRDGKFTAATDFQIADDGCSLSLWSGTFPGGIKVEAINGATKDELAGFLYNNNAYFQNCEKVTLTAGQSEISGGHVVVAYDAKHQFGSNTKCSYCGLDAIVSMSLDGVTTYYGTVYDLQQDLVQENAGCTIQLLADITTTYFSDKDGRCGFYLDLNGHTLTASDGVSLPGSSGCTIMDTSAEKNGKIVGTVYAAYSTALTGGTIEGTVSFPMKASATGYTFRMEGGAIDADMDFGISDNNTTIVLTGGTFPGGISIACGDNVTTPMTLADCISGNYKYFKDGSVVTLTEGQTEITGGDVTVAEHTGHTHTYNAEGFCEGILPDTYAVCGSYEKPEGAGTEASPYIIDNAGKLFWFAAVVNGGYEDTQGNSAAWAKVTEEITIPEGMAWTPISGYTGTFDGGSKTISGMHCTSDATYVGMFSRTGKCTIQNVYLSDSSFESTDGRGSVGAIAGYAGESEGNSTVISGCSVSNTTVTGYTAGGIAGTLYGFSEISNSNPDCTVNAEGEGGGAVGRCQSGSEIQWVSAQGTVTGNYAGGVVGYVVNDVGPYESRTNDVLLSTFTGSVGSENTTYAGGIIGFVSNATKASINNCSVKCSVTAKYAVTSRACGLLGHSDNDTTGAVTVSNSFTIDTTLGVANINKASLASGGVTVTNCYSDDAANPLVVSGRTTDCAVKTDEQFKSGEVAYLLDAPQTTHAWGQNIDNGNQNYGFPVRGQHKVYQVVADCRGSVGYSNTESTETPSHNYVNGFCTNEAEGVVCDAYEPAVPVTSENYTELGLTEDYVGYYAITNAGQLYWFADKVDNENDTYKTANVVLTADITVNTGTMDANTTGAREWNPIGYWVSGRDYAAFNGTFDGNNKKISGLYFNNTESTTGRNAALIAETESGALVKNVTVTNTWFHGYGQVAGIVGDNGGTITGCVSEASLSCTWSYIGGVAGWNEGTITGCINRGTIAGSYNNSGGIVGHNAGTVELCGNEGSISDNWCYAGGIAGNNAGIIRNCWNTGEIYVTNNIAGGITGMNNSDDLVENCWSTGVVSCGRDSEAIGGIVGRSQSAIQKNCYSLMEPVGQIKDKDGGSASTVENMDRITLEQLASGEVAYLLRIRAAEGTDVWGQNIDNGETVQTVPALNGADVYYGYFDCASTEAKLTNTAVSATPVAHDYDNGFCEMVEGETHYEPAVPVTSENYSELGLTEDYVGYYAITNAGQLYWFADKVDNENATYRDAKAVLTENITINSGTVTAESTGLRTWNPIGKSESYGDHAGEFDGIFDGNGKTVSGLYFKDTAATCVGLFAVAGENAEIMNLTLSNSYLYAKYQIGGIVGFNYGNIVGCTNTAAIGSSTDTVGGIVGNNFGTVEMCGNRGTIASDKQHAAGIVGYNHGTVNNCWNTGKVHSGGNWPGGIVGMQEKVTGTMEVVTKNCWSTGEVVMGSPTAGGVSDYGGGIIGEFGNNTTVENCYTTQARALGKMVNGRTDILGVAEYRSDAQFASGEVAYLLRTRAAEGTNVWGQNIDNDQTKQGVPALNGADVYQVVLDCAGSLGYSNTNADKIVHNYDDNGFCTNENAEGGLCDAYEPAVPVTDDNYTELGLTADYVGYYAISNAGQLYWFADKVDNEHDTYGSVNVVLTKNITVNEGQITSESTGMRQWIPAGDRDHQYGGTFDGNGKTISGLYYNDNGNNNSKYVALISCMAESGVVKNVTVTNSVFIGYEYTAAIVGYNYGTVTGCVNNAPISGATYSAGIVADNRGTVELCGNTGTVYASWAVSGGIVARSLSSGAEDAAVVENCWNTGSISSEYKTAGGIVGESSAQVGSYAYARVRNCWSTGSVSAPEAVGGVTGRNWRAAVSNCYSVMAPVGVLENSAYTDKTEQKTLEQFASGEVAYLLGGVWGQDLDNDKMPQTVPTFDGADVYQITVDCAGTIGYSNTDADKVSHVPTHVPAVAATCTEEGNIEHWSCVCGKFFAEEACTTELAAEDISVQPTGHTYGAEGTCTNINNGVVCGHGAGASLTTKTGGTKFFDTLQEALDAAKTTVAADEAVVKVLKDVVNTDKISAVKAKGGVFTLDVGDAKLVGDDYGLSVENATVTITGNTGYIDCIYGLYSDLIIDGVTVKAQQSSSTAINMQYCNLTVKSGSVINNKYGGYAILGYGEDYEIVIEGGTITATGTAGKGIALMGGTTVSVTGGIINAVEDIITMDGLCSLSGVLAGGSFPGGLYLKEDYREPNMNEVLADGFAYWQQDVQVDVDDDAVSIQGDVEVKSDCKHPSITYSASGYVLTADCDTCSAASALELIPQTDAEKIYSGTEKSAAYTGSILGLDTVPVTYTGDRVNVGSFTASVTVGGAAVEMPMEIVPYELEVKTFTLADKVYDGTNACAVTSLSFVSTANGEELVLGTDFTAQLTFPAADAGDYTDAVLTVELMPTALASNYILKSDTVTGISHSIDPATITVTDVKVAEKVYDGTTDATVTSVTASGIVAGDDVKVEVQAAFADKNSGTDKPVNLTYTLSGADAGNYVLAEKTGRTTTSITVKPLEEIVEPVKDLSVDNVTSDDKETLEDVKEELEFVLTDEGLSDEQRKEREDALQDVQDMLDRIQDVADAITTDPIMDTKDITADNITLDEREDVEQALEDLYGALEDYENNYTDAEKEGIHDDIERLEAALAALKQVEDLIKDIEELPDEVQPDTPYRKDILEAKDAYDALDDHQKDLVPEEIVQKLNDLLADLKVYLIIEGDGQTWTDGDLSFTANGPFDLFMELKIDGITVAASNYTAVSGSTVLTLKESYVETLTAGKHSIKFVYPDGEAVGSFTVEIPTNGSATTGDEAPILLLAVMMSVSLAGALMLLERKRKV